MQVSTYLFQFNFNLRHKSNKQHIFSNALFKLFSNVNIVEWINEKRKHA